MSKFEWILEELDLLMPFPSSGLIKSNMNEARAPLMVVILQMYD